VSRSEDNFHPVTAYQFMIIFECSDMDDGVASKLFAFAHRTKRKDLFANRNNGKNFDYYGVKYRATLDDNATFVVWDAKMTREMAAGQTIRNQQHVDVDNTTFALSLENIGNPLVALHDPLSSVPETYAFVETRGQWEYRFMEFVREILARQRKEKRRRADGLE
jgi:hypothetical protein